MSLFAVSGCSSMKPLGTAECINNRAIISVQPSIGSNNSFTDGSYRYEYKDGVLISTPFENEKRLMSYYYKPGLDILISKEFWVIKGESEKQYESSVYIIDIVRKPPVNYVTIEKQNELTEKVFKDVCINKVTKIEGGIPNWAAMKFYAVSFDEKELFPEIGMRAYRNDPRYVGILNKCHFSEPFTHLSP